MVAQLLFALFLVSIIGAVPGAMMLTDWLYERKHGKQYVSYEAADRSLARKHTGR